MNNLLEHDKPDYPTELEQFWLQTAMRETHTRTDRDALNRLLPDIRRLADRFTVERNADDAIGAYFQNTRHCAAYSLFFAPQTYARTRLLLRDIPALEERESPWRILDLGGGTGAAAWAILDALPEAAAAQVDMLDQSRAALRCATDLFASLRGERWPDSRLRTVPGDLTEPLPFKEPYDLISIHYTLNELDAENQRRLLSRAARLLKPDGHLLIAEPLRHDVGDYMRHLREQALQAFDLKVAAPCPHQAACPLPAPCHDVRTWRVPRSMQILNAKLKRDVSHLAFAALILTQKPNAGTEGVTDESGPGPSPIRVVGSPTHLKGYSQFPACCADGTYKTIQVLHRDLDIRQRKWLRHLERGECVAVRNMVQLGDGVTYRAEISA